MSNYDLVVVGNGIIAYSTAFKVSKEDPTLKIAIIGPSRSENGASLSSGAMLNCFGEITTQTFQTHPNREKFNMAYQALKMWPSWIKLINDDLPKEDHLEVNDGTFVILNSRSSSLDTDNFLSILGALKAYQEPFQEIDPSNIKEINPSQSGRPLRSIWIPGEGCISSHQTLNVFESIYWSYMKISLCEK